MFNRIKQRGFTLMELLLVIWVIFVICLIIFGLCVGVHFILKFW